VFAFGNFVEWQRRRRARREKPPLEDEADDPVVWL
jgi:hypothetical protein